MPLQAFAQEPLEDPIKLAYAPPLNTSIDNSGRSYERREARETPNPSSNRIKFDYALFETRVPTPHLPNYWNTYANRPRHRYVPDYEGLHGLIYKQIARVCSRYYRQYEREYWQQRADLDPYYLSDYRRFKLYESDFHNRWWDRSFFDSFEIEDGGTETRTYTVGESCEVFSLGPLSLNNSGRVSWEGWRLNFSAQRERSLDQDYDDLGNPLPRNRVNERAIVFGISPPSGNIYTAGSWTLSGAVKVNFRLNNLQDNGSSIRGKLNFIAYMGRKPKPWLEAELEATARPMRGDYRVTIMFALLQW